MRGKKLTKLTHDHVYPCPVCGKIPKIHIYPDNTCAVVMCRTWLWTIKHSVVIISETTPEKLISDATKKWNGEVIRHKIEEISNETNTRLEEYCRPL